MSMMQNPMEMSMMMGNHQPAYGFPPLGLDTSMANPMINQQNVRNTHDTHSAEMRKSRDEGAGNQNIIQDTDNFRTHSSTGLQAGRQTAAKGFENNNTTSEKLINVQDPLTCSPAAGEGVPVLLLP